MNPENLLYSCVRSQLPHGFNAEDFERFLKGWKVDFVYQEGSVAGVVAIRDNEIHIAFIRTPRGSIRGLIRTILVPLVRQYGSAITWAQNQQSLRFCERLGFVKIGQRNGVLKMRCEKVIHEFHR